MLQLQIVNFKQGSYLVVEGKADSDHFYIIQKGSVQCLKSTGNGTSTVLYGPGDFVGVVPCMSGHLQIETAIARTDVLAISVKKEQYPELIAQNTPVALKIIKTFANRMRVMNEMLTKATLHSVVKEDYEQIFNVAKFYDKTSRKDIAAYAYYQYLKTKPTGPNAETAKAQFIALKPCTHAVYFEPNADLTRSYPKDTMIFSESQSGADMFIIQSGEVTISKVVNGNEVTLAVLKKGDMFGEMALLENKKALVTGSSRGIGRAIVEAYLNEGAEVWGLCSKPSAAKADLEALAASKGTKFHEICANVGDAAALTEVITAAVTEAFNAFKAGIKTFEVGKWYFITNLDETRFGEEGAEDAYCFGNAIYLKDKYNHKISGGEKRMAAIATVLAMEPSAISCANSLSSTWQARSACLSLIPSDMWVSEED